MVENISNFEFDLLVDGGWYKSGQEKKYFLIISYGDYFKVTKGHINLCFKSSLLNRLYIKQL